MVGDRAARQAFAPKWTPHGFFQRLRSVVRTRADAWLAAEMAIFLWRAPALMRKMELPEFLAKVRARPRRQNADVFAELERIVRLRSAWLRLPWFRRSNTCYVRALTVYRFLDCSPHRIDIRFGVERPRDGRGRLHGHAWITVDDRILEGPDAVILGRVREVPIGPRIP